MRAVIPKRSLRRHDESRSPSRPGGRDADAIRTHPVTLTLLERNSGVSTTSSVKILIVELSLTLFISCLFISYEICCFCNVFLFKHIDPRLMELGRKRVHHRHCRPRSRRRLAYCQAGGRLQGQTTPRRPPTWRAVFSRDEVDERCRCRRAV